MAAISGHNRQQYDRFAAEYHAKRLDPRRSFYNEHLEQPMMAKLLRTKVKGKAVLELGCGSGLFTRKLVKWGASVTGIDISDSMLSLARQALPEVEFRRAEISRLPFVKARFEVVASSLVLHYVKNLVPVCREVGRVLKPGGTFVFSMHHPISSFWLLNAGEKGLSPANVRSPGYFRNAAYRWRMLAGMELVSHHQTFESIVEGLRKAGFAVESLLEAKPAAGTRKLDPKGFDQSRRFPTFVAIKAIKLGNARRR